MCEGTVAEKAFRQSASEIRRTRRLPAATLRRFYSRYQTVQSTVLINTVKINWNKVRDKGFIFKFEKLTESEFRIIWNVRKIKCCEKKNISKFVKLPHAFLPSRRYSLRNYSSALSRNVTNNARYGPAVRQRANEIFNSHSGPSKKVLDDRPTVLSVL
ncbi:hypothetical protein PUN28_002301 [Cardiocondyla obscurior]|uniref:Uncharacterized protein n=1 Tax=Cardiocondyla obscurior TaxID=286306 RepID=A0AAW2GTC9_9HYME